jgi:ferredoxin
MAEIANKYAENMSGKFYVDDQCIDCDLCRETARANFMRSNEGGYSYVFKQPTTPRRRRRFVRKPWKDVRFKPSATMAKAGCDRTVTMELPSQTNATNGRTRSTRASQRSGTLQLWEGPGVFRAGSFARPIYRKEETERFRATSTKKPKENAKHR